MSKLQEKINNKKILVLAAHPDDESLGCGGTIHKLSQLGNNVELLTFTDGVSSRQDDKDNRNKKLELVSKVLGISKFNYSNFPDNAMDSVPLLDLCKFIEKNIDYTPDIIFTHFAGDLNIGHQLVSKATLTVFRPQKENKTKIYSYYVPSSTDYNPLTNFDGNSYYSLGKSNINAKLEALWHYHEEMREYPHTRSYKNISNLMKVWGSEVGHKYCEKFKLIREVL